jgi:hypothetical protein
LECKELLTIRVIITNKETVSDGDYRKSKIYFTGYCDTKYFHGTILPGGCDKQDYYLDKLTKVSAEYNIAGYRYGRHKMKYPYRQSKREWGVENGDRNR